VAAGDVVFRRGEHDEEMFVVLQGKVAIKVDDRVIETLEPGSIFGEMAIADDYPRSADAVVVEDGKIEPIDQEWFKHLVRKSPSFGLHVMSVMAKRLRRHMGAAA